LLGFGLMGTLKSEAVNIRVVRWVGRATDGDRRQPSLPPIHCTDL